MLDRYWLYTPPHLFAHRSAPALGRSIFGGSPASRFGRLCRLAIPGGTGNFTDFCVPPSPLSPSDPIAPSDPIISGQTVAFIGYGASGQTGIYVKTPQDPVLPVVDSNTAVPDGPTGKKFQSFKNVSLDGNNIAFVGGGTLFVEFTTGAGGGV